MTTPASFPVQLPPPSPGLVLHQAAAELRKLAEAVEVDVAGNPYWSSAEHPPHDYPNLYARGVDNGLGGPAGRYAAAMHPGVGLALADWFDYQARLLVVAGHPDADHPLARHALAVARAVLAATS